MTYNPKPTFLLVIILTLCNLNSNAQMYINGPFTIGGTLSVFPDLQIDADAQLLFQDGSTLHMFGESTLINSNAEIFANTTSTQIGTGRILFEGTSAQTLNAGNSSTIGGTQPSLINIAIDNPDNVTLTSTNTRITSGIDFIDGHIIIGSQNLELASTSTITNTDETQYIVTNGTGFLVKEGLATSTSFIYPFGRATSDYTPVTVSNPSATDDFYAQVKNYSESGSVESVTTDGIDRTWNIFSTNGSGATIALQHNGGTGGTSGTAFDPNDAFVTQYQGLQAGQGVWQTGTSANGPSATGSITNSLVSSRPYSNTATSSSADAAFFSKSSNILTPLPVTLFDFVANKRNESQSILTWSTTSEYKSSHFEVETSTNGELWTKIGEVKAQAYSYNLTNYQFFHLNPIIGVNYYRLNSVDLDGVTEYSPIRMLQFGNLRSYFSNIDVYPNPSNGILNISSISKSYSFTLTDMHGKSIHSFNNLTEENDFQVDLSMFANGVYFIKANSPNGDVKVFKIILNK